jgi:hypothetical protein
MDEKPNFGDEIRAGLSGSEVEDAVGEFDLVSSRNMLRDEEGLIPWNKRQRPRRNLRQL